MASPNKRGWRRDRCAIAVMAKAPTFGSVKARLSPFLSPDEAKQLSCCFLRDITANLTIARREVPLDAYIAFTPAGSETAFSSMAEPEIGFVLADGNFSAPPGVEGFGRSLLQAVWSLLDQGYSAVGLLNSDSPTLPTSSLIDAARLLNDPHNSVVLGTSVDGGYYFIGLKGRNSNPFRAIDWSTNHVAEQTRARVREIGVDIIDLNAWYDVDDVTSLRKLVLEVSMNSLQMASEHIPYAAPFTTGWLQRHRIVDRFEAQSSSGITSV